jgi:hypothetical protein
MAQGSSPPPPEIRSPDDRPAAEDAAEAEAEAEVEEVFDDAFDIPHKNAPHDRLRRWRVRDRLSPLTLFPSDLDPRLAGCSGIWVALSVWFPPIWKLLVRMPYSNCLSALGE